MARLEFLNNADFTDYPLQAGQDLKLADPLPLGTDDLEDDVFSSSSIPGPNCGAGARKLPRRGIADAGFLLGPQALFRPAFDGVYLHAISIASDGAMEFDYRSDAPGGHLRRWLFYFSGLAGEGCTSRATASGPHRIPYPGFGSGFMTLGNPVELRELAEGYYRLCASPRLEPARLQVLSCGVSSINLANRARLCPSACGHTPPTPEAAAAVWPAVTGLTGERRFRAGYNVRILMDGAINALTLSADFGSGAGGSCGDYLVDQHGVRPAAGECQDDCDSYVRTLDGQGSPDADLKIIAGNGITVIPDQADFKVIILAKDGVGCATP